MGVRLPDVRSASMMASPSIIPRQHPVHDDHIVGLAGGEKHAVAAVVGVVGRVAGLLQPLDDEAPDALVVLDQQNLHADPRVEPRLAIAASSSCSSGSASAAHALHGGSARRHRASHAS